MQYNTEYQFKLVYNELTETIEHIRNTWSKQIREIDEDSDWSIEDNILTFIYHERWGDDEYVELPISVFWNLDGEIEKILEERREKERQQQEKQRQLDENRAERNCIQTEEYNKKIYNEAVRLGYIDGSSNNS